MKKRLFGIFLIILAMSLVMIDAHFLYGHYLTAGTTVTIIPLVSLASIIPLCYGVSFARGE